MISPLNLLQMMRLRDIRVTDHMTGAEKRDLLDWCIDYRAFRIRISSTGTGQSLGGMDFSLAAKSQRQHLPIFLDSLDVHRRKQRSGAVWNISEAKHQKLIRTLPWMHWFLMFSSVMFLSHKYWPNLYLFDLPLSLRFCLSTPFVHISIL